MVSQKRHQPNDPRKRQPNHYTHHDGRCTYLESHVLQKQDNLETFAVDGTKSQRRHAPHWRHADSMAAVLSPAGHPASVGLGGGGARDRASRAARCLACARASGRSGGARGGGGGGRAGGGDAHAARAGGRDPRCAVRPLPDRVDRAERAVRVRHHRTHGDVRRGARLGGLDR